MELRWIAVVFFEIARGSALECSVSGATIYQRYKLGNRDFTVWEDRGDFGSELSDDDDD